MKKIILISSFLCLAPHLSAEEVKPTITVKINDLMPLSHHPGETKYKSRTDICSVFGRLESPTRIQDHTPHIFVSGSDQKIQNIYLVKLMGNFNDYSRFTYITAKLGTIMPYEENFIEIERKKNSDGMWELWPKKSLRRGEYALFGFFPSTPIPPVFTDYKSKIDDTPVRKWYESIVGDFWDFGIDD